MHPLMLNAALQEIMKLCMLWEIDPDTVTVSTFAGHGGRNVLRARTTVRGVLTTMDIYVS